MSIDKTWLSKIVTYYEQKYYFVYIIEQCIDYPNVYLPCDCANIGHWVQAVT